MTGTQNRPSIMLVFDVDGVITDPETGELSQEVLQIVAADLRRGLPVGFISGRTFRWMDEHVLGALNKVCTEDELSRLLVVAEKGGVTAFRQDGRFHVQADSKLSPPRIFKQEAEALLAANQGGWSFNDTMHWDEEKQTMATITKKPGISRIDFAAARAPLVKHLQEILKKHELNDFRVDPTTIATDIEHVTAGKQKGAQDILGWLQKHGIIPGSFRVFGDSPSDSAMAETFAAHGYQTTFVFVGDPSHFSRDSNTPYEIVITGGGFANDTADYLRDLKLSA